MLIYIRTNNITSMKTDKYLRVSYNYIDDGYRRIQCLPLGFVFRITGKKNYYEYPVFQNAEEVIRFDTGNRIIKDHYGQHWYQRKTKVGAMEEYDIYEPLPEYVVSEEYERKRIEGMHIYPYLRVDFSRKLIEVYENCMFPRRDDEDREEFHSLNKGFIDDAE